MKLWRPSVPDRCGRVPESGRKPPALQKPDPAELYAALDLGTNSCRMLIAQPKGNQFHVVDSFFEIGSAGTTGSEKTYGRLSRVAPWQRTMQRAPDLPPASSTQLQGPPHAAGGNGSLPPGQECRRRVPEPWCKRETGLTLEIIKPEEEARLAVVSCAPLVSTKTEQLLVVDIGGGSTELVWIDLSAVPRQERPRAIMRLHAGFHPPESPFRPPRSSTGFRCRLASRR